MTQSNLFPSDESPLSFHDFQDMTSVAASSVAGVEREARRPGRDAKPKGFNPVSNTGLNLQVGLPLEISLDYVVLTGRLSSIDVVREQINSVAARFLEDGAVVFTEDKGMTIGRYYQSTARTPNGCLFAYSLSDDGGHFDVRFSIPGKVLKRVHFKFVWRSLKCLRQFGLKPTRIDIALDDYSKQLHPDLIRQAIRDNNLIRIRKTRTNIDDSSPCVGFTIYLGSRQSNSMLRYYDKLTESNGVLDCWRLELEAKEECAISIWDALFTLPEYDESWCKSLLLECVIGALDFRDRSHDSNIARCPRLAWWQCFVEDCQSSGGVRLPRAKQESTLKKKLAWVNRQVETTLAMLEKTLGPSGFRNYIQICVESGRRRFGRVHESILELHSERGCERISEFDCRDDGEYWREYV
jgi:hypothetical protein